MEGTQSLCRMVSSIPARGVYPDLPTQYFGGIFQLLKCIWIFLGKSGGKFQENPWYIWELPVDRAFIAVSWMFKETAEDNPGISCVWGGADRFHRFSFGTPSCTTRLQENQPQQLLCHRERSALHDTSDPDWVGFFLTSVFLFVSIRNPPPPNFGIIV